MGQTALIDREGLLSQGPQLTGPASQWPILPYTGHLGHAGPCASCSPLGHDHCFSRKTLRGSMVSTLIHFTDEKTEARRGRTPFLRFSQCVPSHHLGSCHFYLFANPVLEKRFYFPRRERRTVGISK